MSGHVAPLSRPEEKVASSAQVRAALAAADFTDGSATVVGYGGMGRQYVAALEALGVKTIRVVGRSIETLRPLAQKPWIEVVQGGIETFSGAPRPDEVGMVAVPVARLLPAVEKLLSLGFRKILMEKPVSLYSQEIERLARLLEETEALGICAYNRVAYPSFLECRSRVAEEGGATSCAYTFTELISSDWERRFSREELARWGIANSLHVIGMAHRLIGLPKKWSGSRAGSLSWHPSGSVFVGSGVSEEGVPFSYHADWGSAGRWSVEVHTGVSSYRLCPLERLMRRVDAKADWMEIPLQVFATQVKAGFVEQVAAMLHPEIRARVPLVDLSQAAALARFGEELFGYEGS